MASTAFCVIVDQLMEGGYGVRFRVQGRSMFPVLQEGDFLTVVPLPQEAPRVGDLVVFRRGDLLLAHRVRKMVTGEDGTVHLFLRGDNSITGEGPVSLGEIKGIVHLAERDGRSFRLHAGWSGWWRRWAPEREWKASLQRLLQDWRRRAVMGEVNAR